MKGLNKIITPVLVFFGVFLSPSTVYADDIEIYYSNPEGGDIANIVMMLDTSGSMDTNECVEFAADGSCTRKGKRIDELKTALYRVIDTVSSNARIGIGVYNQNDGGRLIYPVSDLDAADVSGVAEAFITSDDHDGGFDYDNSSTLFFDNSNFYTSFPASNTRGHQIGLIFSDVNVPRNATIKSAYVRVMAAGDYGSGNVRYQYAYEVPSSLTDEPAAFGGIAGRNISARYSGSTNEAWTAVSKYDVDVTAGIQAAVEEPNWCGRKDLALFFGADGPTDHRFIYMREALNAKEGETSEAAPQLIVEWDTTRDPNTNATSTEADMACQSELRFGLGSALDDGYAEGGVIELEESDSFAGPSSKVGLRFTKIPFDLDDNTSTINDVVHSAKLHIKGDQNNSDFQLNIAAVLGPTPPFDSTLASTITGLPTTPAISYTVPKGDWDQWTEIDVTPIVRAALSHEFNTTGDLPSWERRESLGLIITASVDGVPVDMYEEGASSAAYLMMSASTDSLGNILNRVRDKLKERVASISAFGNTPSMEAYSEMARYYLGDTVEYAFEDVSDRIGMVDGTNLYDSPLTTDSCSSNNIVLLTDGMPTNDGDYNRAVESLTGKAGCNAGYTNNYGSYNCQESLAAWLYDGTQNTLGVPIKTHTVAFTNDSDLDVLMQGVSAAGGNGVHAKARNATELTAAFEEIINSVTVENASMAAPGVAVNQLNRFRHLDQLYYALFKPSTTQRWEGNLKRYRITLDSANPKVVDSAGAEAVDPNNGFFKDTAKSFWSSAVDGSDATAGGAREMLAPDSRSLYVALSDPGHGTTDNATSAPGGATSKLFDEWNDFTATDLGLAAAATQEERTTLWKLLLNGWADPLHSEPVLVNYGFSGSLEEAILDPSLQDNAVFVATNDGMVSAIDPSSGKEYFALMPRSELARTADRRKQRELQPPNFSRGTYGLDGGITVWRRGDGGSGVEHVYLYVAQRRGGKKIFAVDATSRTSPKVIWSITGGQFPFDNLGETWSQPTLTQVQIGGNKIPVLVFGGGYSAADHDDTGVVTNGDAVGNSLYIVNAYNGSLIWSASDTGATMTNPDMDYSVVASPSVVDFDFDGVVDYIYFTDLGGQVFRVDMNRNAGGASEIAYRVATLARLGRGESAGISNHRRFYSSPVVAVNYKRSGYLFQVAIGSGYRAHPLDEQTQDRIFMIDDEDAITGSGGMASLSAGATISPAVTTSDLYDVTTNLSPEETTVNSYRGWYINLETGEKVLAAASVLDGVVYFTTYLPKSKAIDQCTNVIGSARLYGMSALDGSPAADFDNDGTVDASRSIDLQLTGLPPSPQALVGKDGNLVILTGTVATSAGELEGADFRKTRWFELPDQQRVDQYLLEKGAINP